MHLQKPVTVSLSEVKHSVHAEVSRRWEVGPDARALNALGKGSDFRHKVSTCSVTR